MRKTFGQTWLMLLTGNFSKTRTASLVILCLFFNETLQGGSYLNQSLAENLFIIFQKKRLCKTFQNIS